MGKVEIYILDDEMKSLILFDGIAWVFVASEYAYLPTVGD